MTDNHDSDTNASGKETDHETPEVAREPVPALLQRVDARAVDGRFATLLHLAVIERAYQQEAERGARIKTALRVALDNLPHREKT